jgi:hypothetical protein
MFSTIDNSTGDYNTNIITKIVKDDVNNVAYKILNYDKSRVSLDDYETQKYRSVILAYPENTVLSYSPPKSIQPVEFMYSFPDNHPEFDYATNIVYSEIVEGTMVNVFYDWRIEKWTMATRSAVGGKYWYYRNDYVTNSGKTENGKNMRPREKTFYQMFMEALQIQSLEELAFLEKEYCYSFVLQHPENHIVFDIVIPAVYLIAIYKITDNTLDDNTGIIYNIQYISPVIFSKWAYFENIDTTNIRFPKIYNFNSYQDAINLCNLSPSYHEPNFMGVMATNIFDGTRATFRNMHYEHKKNIRGNHPNLLYHFICLLKVGKTYEFLNYFPQYQDLFFEFSRKYQKCMNEIQQFYYERYIKKDTVEIPKKYLQHIYYLHNGIFIPSLAKEQKTIITRQVVNNYFIQMVEPNYIYNILLSI